MDKDILTIKSAQYEYVEMMPYLKEKYGRWIIEGLKGVNLIHKGGNVFVEILIDSGIDNSEESPKIVCEWDNLKYISGDDYMHFNAEKPIEENALRFIDLDAYTCLITASKIFTKEAEEQILSYYSQQVNNNTK
jgi:hypothetical protein